MLCRTRRIGLEAYTPRVDAAAFLVALRRNTGSLPNIADPMADALAFLKDHGDTGEGLALRRVMRTLATGEGQFSEADIYSFSKKTCGLVSVLLDMRDMGRYSPEQWQALR